MEAQPYRLYTASHGVNITTRGNDIALIVQQADAPDCEQKVMKKKMIPLQQLLSRAYTALISVCTP
jgi:hypothetical protein